MWEETLQSVRVTHGGFFHVLLGQINPIRPDLLSGACLWLAVQLVRGGRVGEEQGPRVPVLCAPLRATEDIGALEQGLGLLRSVMTKAGLLSDHPADEPLLLEERFDLLQDGLRHIERRVSAVERAALDAPSDPKPLPPALAEKLETLEERVLCIEDELEDIIGPEGDIVEIVDRMDRLETLLPGPSRAEAVERERQALLRRVNELEQVVGTLARDLEAVRAGLMVSPPEAPTSAPPDDDPLCAPEVGGE
jgi:hypothetical protein